jgi:Domain of unknown function (DUF4335)
MNIQRKYSLPNCTLLLEGLSDASRTVHFQEMRPELSILVNAECHLASYNQPLVGGREFFESLVRAVSAYAQEFLSSVPNPQAHDQESELVQFQKIDTDRHRLIVSSEIAQKSLDSRGGASQQPVEIDLNTVQLFDLVEAVDQFFADSQTLPELSLGLQPVARPHGLGNQTFAKQALPATVGVSSLAVAAIVLSLVPLPRPSQPKPQEETGTTAPSVTPSLPTAEIPTPSASPIAAATPEPTATPTVSPITGQTPIPTPSPTTAAVPGTQQDLEALINTVPEITDASQLRALNRQVYNQVNPSWNGRNSLQENLVYRVGVAADGKIIGYKAVNKGANEGVGKTPLPNLLYSPAVSGSVNKEPIAQFRVVFNKQGVLEVSPWLGYSATPQVVGAKITDANAVKDLNKKLFDTVRKNWTGKPTYAKDLKYRVAITKDAAIADYEPLNQLAFDYFRETPLPQIFAASHGGSNSAAPTSQEPLAHYQVTFKPSGELEIIPWQGYK